MNTFGLITLDAPLIVCGIVMFCVVVGMPLALLLRARKEQTKESLAASSRETPGPCFLWGFILTAGSFGLFSLFFFGYLLPGLGWIERNSLSEIPIRIRRGRHGSESDPIGIQDVDMSLLISGIVFVVLLFGLFLLWRGLQLNRTRRSTAKPIA